MVLAVSNHQVFVYVLIGQLRIDKNKMGEGDRADPLERDRQETGQWSSPKTALVKTRLHGLQPA